MLTTALVALGALGCSKAGEESAKKAAENVQYVAKAVTTDVAEVRKGLPIGAQHLEAFFKEGKPGEDAAAAKEALNDARGRVQDLRTAKSTFFFIADPTGAILRSDQDQDLLAGKNVFAAFPELKRALGEAYVESRGSMEEAAGVRGRADGQWVAAVPVKPAGGAPLGIYGTGWSWSAYAYRLENQLRSHVRSEGGKEPLTYVYVVVAGAVYGAPVSPDVNVKAVQEQRLLDKAKGTEVVSVTLEITGRDFGAALRRTPELGEDVGVAVLRSET